MSHFFDELFTWPSMWQLLVVTALILISIAAGGKIQRMPQARYFRLHDGIKNRIFEALVIVSGHCIALLLIAAVLGLMYTLHATTNILAVVLKLTGLLLITRLTVYVLRVSVGNRAPIKGWGNTISFIVWVAWSLHVLGWFDAVTNTLDDIGIQAGESRISLWSVVKLLTTVTAFVLMAIWVARWVERQLMAMSAMTINVRIGISKFIQAFLVGLSIMLGLHAAGVDLTTLNVLTGAIGIGLGFGLQAIASNFVSGFVLLMDRSIKPGDVISLSGVSGGSTEHFGWVQELRGRYVVIRDRDGVETLVPNQHFITNPVINWSYTDPKVRLRLPIRISYKDDPELALRLLIQATEDNSRVLHDPLPVARLMSFGDSGLELELRFWISDPQEGVNSVRSDVNRTIWRLFRDNGISMPVAQREVVLHMSEPRKTDV